MLKTLFIVLLASSTLAIQAHSRTTDELMDRVMAMAHIPGAVVAVVRDGKVVTIQTYGNANLEYRIPVTPETPFQIASATKIYLGAADAHGGAEEA